jgi:hypothetical protein
MHPSSHGWRSRGLPPPARSAPPVRRRSADDNAAGMETPLHALVLPLGQTPMEWDPDAGHKAPVLLGPLKTKPSVPAISIHVISERVGQPARRTQKKAYRDSSAVGRWSRAPVGCGSRSRGQNRRSCRRDQARLTDNLCRSCPTLSYIGEILMSRTFLESVHQVMMLFV